MTTVLNPGVRRTVAWLNAKGWPTCDSGDGETRDHECDRDHAYVVIQLPPHRVPHIVAEVEGLASALRVGGVVLAPLGPDGPPTDCVTVTGSYSTDGIAFIDVQGLTDAMLFPEKVGP